MRITVGSRLSKTGVSTTGLFAGVLAAGNYTVTFRSAANGFKDANGGLLDGNGDGASGDNYVTTFTVGGAADVTFKLNYNPALLNITSTLSNTSGAFTLVGTPSAGVANFSFHSNTALNGNVTLGQIVTQVPDSAASSYKSPCPVWPAVGQARQNRAPVPAPGGWRRFAPPDRARSRRWARRNFNPTGCPRIA